MALFSDNNFEEEFVDTTNDHDTLPLDQNVISEEDGSQKSEKATDTAATEGDNAQKVDDGLAVNGEKALLTKGPVADADSADSQSGSDLEESVTEAAAKAKKQAEEDEKAELLKER